MVVSFGPEDSRTLDRITAGGFHGRDPVGGMNDGESTTIDIDVGACEVEGADAGAEKEGESTMVDEVDPVGA